MLEDSQVVSSCKPPLSRAIDANKVGRPYLHIQYLVHQPNEKPGLKEGRNARRGRPLEIAFQETIDVASFSVRIPQGEIAFPYALPITAGCES